MPHRVSALARRHRLGPARLAWRNELGGLTFDFPRAGQFVKWLPYHPEFDVVDEAARLSWAGRYVSVPEVLETGSDEDGQWLRTRAVPGTSAVSDRWRREPRIAARAIGAGLRELHERLPVDECPFSWSLGLRLSRAIEPPAEEPPPIERLVVCHGDPCSPNTLIGEDGRCTGHVDLNQLGVADRWADLAVATYSLGWNFEGWWEDELLDAYGIERDQARIDYYRRLWDAT